MGNSPPEATARILFSTDVIAVESFGLFPSFLDRATKRKKERERERERERKRNLCFENYFRGKENLAIFSNGAFVIGFTFESE